MKDGGRLAVVITQTLFQTKGAGDGFRRFRLGPDGPPLGVLRVNDLVAARPFPSAANWTATLLLEKGRPTEYPVPYIKWSVAAPGLGEPASDRSQNGVGAERAFQRQCYHARPADPEHPASPWFLWPQQWDGGAAGNGRSGLILGPSDYQAHLGANTGGANGVYWVELVDPALLPSGAAAATVRIRNSAGRAKRSVPMVEDRVEPDLLYPLLRWADVARYRALPGAFLILAQDPGTRRGIDEALLRERYPATHAYLRRFQEMLVGRAAYRRYQAAGPFYSMYDVGPYTLAPIKVVWRRMDRRLNAAVVEERDDPRIGRKPVIPQETCVLVATPSADEAHYLCAY